MTRPPLAVVTITLGAAFGGGVGALVSPVWAGLGAVVGVFLAASLTPRPEDE